MFVITISGPPHYIALAQEAKFNTFTYISAQSGEIVFIRLVSGNRLGFLYNYRF